jgi:tetratricopeptide (TPR) repeat protein
MAYYSYYIYKLIIKLKACVLFTSLSLSLGIGFALAQNQNEIKLAGEYLIKGEKKKAVELYRELSKNENNLPFIHNPYLETMLDLGMFDDAEAYLKKISKKDSDNLLYQLDAGFVYVRMGNLAKADKHFKNLISENKADVHRTKLMSDYLTSKSLMSYAIQCLTESREFLGNPFMFCLELATLYRLQGQREKMVQEYLTYVTQNSGNIQYVKNVMQALLTKPEDLESLEKLLYEKVQQQPDFDVYSDLLIWVTMQQKNFHAAFIQARAYDKRYKKEGEKSMEVARVALDNGDYSEALKIYQYVIREFPSSPNFLLARLGLMHTHEARLRNSYPVNLDSVRTLIVNYKKFISQYPENNNSIDAARNEALLYANYLDEKDSAVHILNNLISNPRSSPTLRARAKLDLGDIYLLLNQPWESSLLYSQVEKMQKENQIGYDAKLKNAKLSYYKGDFKLAQEHLDILKEATTREISNDALDLSMLIKENIGFDTLGLALKEYSAIELLLYQNKTDEALQRISDLKQGNVNSEPVSNQTILDDVYWLEANIRMKRGEFQESIALLEKIVKDFGDDVLADDAYFLQAEIYERQLNNKEKAKEIYREFLNKYPGSIHAADARKRFRELRGDFDQKNP